MLIDYNMSAEYCADWSPIDAIREMVQNAIDSGCEYTCEIKDAAIIVTTKGRELPLNTLMLGQSVKSEGAIGKYGEGYKIGMLVLTREGHRPSILTGYNMITGLFKENQFNVDTFNLKVTDTGANQDDIVFLCLKEGIDEAELKAKIPAFTGTNPKIPKTVDIWQDRPGEIFVNGLFVAKSNPVFGYNFAPANITLNRDRNMVDGVHWQLAKYYASLDVKHADTIFHLIEQDAPDVSDLSYHLTNEALKAELARLFFNKYGEGAKIAKPGTNYYGGSFNVSVSSNASRLYSKCGIEEAKKTVDPEAPDQVLLTWAENNKSKLRRDVRISLDKIVTRAKAWRKAEIY